MTPMTNEEYVRLGMRIAVYVREGHRDGQATFNALHDVRPDIAEHVRGSNNPVNPFYCDDRLEAFYDFLFAYGSGSVNTEWHTQG